MRPTCWPGSSWPVRRRLMVWLADRGWAVSAAVDPRSRKEAMLRKAGGICVVIALALLADGCGATSAPPTTPPATINVPTSANLAASTHSAEPQFSPAATILAKGNTGDSATIAIAVGKPVPPGDADPAAAGCIPDFSSAAFQGRSQLAPVQFTVQITSSLPAKFALEWNELNALDDFAVTQPVQYCANDGRFAVVGNAGPGAPISYVTWFVARDVNTPAHPDGDWKSSHVNTAIMPQVTFAEDNYTDVSVSGAHVCPHETVWLAVSSC